MATINLGAIKFNWKGAYNSSTSYAVDDVVSSGGNSYVCIQAHSNQAVGNATAYWNIMSSAGTNGTNGTDLTSTLTAQGDIVYRDGSGLQRLGAGTNGQALLTGGAGANPSWGNVTSKILNVYSVAYSTNISTTSNSYQTTNLTKTLTPQSATSDFLIQFSFGTQRVAATSATSQYVKLLRGSTDLREYGQGWMMYEATGPGNRGYPPGHFLYVDQPATTSAITYSVQYKSESNSYNTGSEGHKHMIIWEIEGVS